MGDVILICDYSQWSNCAFNLVKSYFTSAVKLSYCKGEEFPTQLENWEGEWIISFKSDLILPRSILNNARKGALNFHPAPPKYRGIGGYIEAIRNRDEFFGATCHWMDNKIDHGAIVKTLKIPMDRSEDPTLLYHKAALCCLNLLAEILVSINRDGILPSSDEKWDKKLYLYNDYRIDLLKIKTEY